MDDALDMSKGELYVSFDEYPRYKIAAQVAAFYRPGCSERKLRVLEIGANAHKHLRLFLPDDEILFTDIEVPEGMEDDPEFRQADGTALPFEDGSFDMVVATDVLEHIPREKRAAFLSEAYRVSSLCTVLTFPQRTEDVLEAEARVNEYHKTICGEDYIWLKEHATYGLPAVEEIDHILQSQGCSFTRLFHGDIRLWETMYYAVFAAVADVQAWEFNRKINAFFNKTIYAGNVSDSCYRAIYILCHDDTAPLEAFLQAERRDGGQNIPFLYQLLSAQRQIYPLCECASLHQQDAAQKARIKYLESQNRIIEAQWKRDAAQWEQYGEQWQEQKNGYEGRIAYLEAQNQAMEEQWKRDAAQFEQYAEQWKRDVSQWQLDNEHWQSDTAQWQEQKNGYEGRIAYLESQNQAMEEQWKKDVAQWEADAAQLSTAQEKCADAEEEAERLSKRLKEKTAAYNEVVSSLSWKLTKPARQIYKLFKF